METHDMRSVVTTLMELADTLVSEFELLDYLDVLLHRTLSVLGGAAGGVMLSAGDDLQLLVSTDERSRMVELFELQREEGPCIDSFRAGTQVAEPDLAATSRWARLGPVAVEQGYRSVLALPMRLRGEVIGVLNLFGKRPGHFNADGVHAAQAFADMASIGILQERAVRQQREVVSQLQTALNARVVVEQAKGILAERAGVDVGQAYEALRSYSRSRNLKLRAVAGAVVAGTVPSEAIVDPVPATRGVVDRRTDVRDA